MWKLKDFIYNSFLFIRLFFYVNLNKKKIINVNNELDKKGWKLTFNDEFNEGKLDDSKWRTDMYFGTRYHPSNIEYENKAPDEYWSDFEFEFTDSIMRQSANDKPKKIHHIDWNGKDWGKWTIPYRAGKIDSSKSFEQKYGYFEIRSKMPNQPGHWTAFWLASVHSWPPEIDIYEIYTGKKNGKGIKMFNSNFHWFKNGKDVSNAKTHKVLDTSEDFNIYAVEWNSKGFKIYYNNILVRVFNNPKVANFFSFPMHIIINNGLDVREEHGIKNAKFPTYHDVDYIRAYKKED